MKTNFSRQRIGKANFCGTHNTFSDFVCMSCRNFVSAEAALSGVHNRNHCPYCLSSRHLDLYEAGDRLSACKATMRPVALTLKKTSKRYTNTQQGELMLVHICDECGKPSINRIAADDDIETVLSIFKSSRKLKAEVKSLLAETGVTILSAEEGSLVQERLAGRN